MKNTSVFGIYRRRESLSDAVDALRTAGFRNADLSALVPQKSGTKEFAHERNTKSAEGTATGAAPRIVLGGALGWLVGIGGLAIPGLGPFIAAGPIMAALATAGAGAVTGTLIGALTGLGLPEYEAKRYEWRIRNGGILLSVHCDNSDWVSRAKEIIEATGAIDIASSGEASADYAKSVRPVVRPVTR